MEKAILQALRLGFYYECFSVSFGNLLPRDIAFIIFDYMVGALFERFITFGMIFHEITPEIAILTERTLAELLAVGQQFYRKADVIPMVLEILASESLVDNELRPSTTKAINAYLTYQTQQSKPKTTFANSLFAKNSSQQIEYFAAFLINSSDPNIELQRILSPGVAKYLSLHSVSLLQTKLFNIFVGKLNHVSPAELNRVLIICSHLLARGQVPTLEQFDLLQKFNVPYSSDTRAPFHREFNKLNFFNLDSDEITPAADFKDDISLQTHEDEEPPATLKTTK